MRPKPSPSIESGSRPSRNRSSTRTAFGSPPYAVRARQHAVEVDVDALDGGHRIVDRLSEVGPLRQAYKMLESRLIGEVQHAALHIVVDTGRCQSPSGRPLTIERTFYYPCLSRPSVRSGPGGMASEHDHIAGVDVLLRYSVPYCAVAVRVDDVAQVFRI